MIRLACLAAALLLATAAHAAVIGHMTPAPPLTRERIAVVAPGDRVAWGAYLDRSDAARRLNDAALTAAGPPLPSGNAAASMPLDRPAAWYATPEARHVADVIVSFQSPAGGWGKNSPRNGAVRQPGQPFSAEKDYVGALDNDATVTELRFLARVVTAGGGAAYRGSFERGVRWLLAAQYPNGGWPQVWPLAGGYHDAVTFNDGAMVAALGLLGDIATGRADYAFAGPGLRRESDLAWRRGLAGLLAAQTGGGWPQQADTLTLAPVGARNFEPSALASAETAQILTYLMGLPEPSPEVVRAVHAAAAWFQRSTLNDKPSPLWARFYDLETNRPIFGDRDRTIHDDVEGISPERRNGYAWYGSGPAKALARYAAWARAHPQR